jgi:hypothetical protein
MWKAGNATLWPPSVADVVDEGGRLVGVKVLDHSYAAGLRSSLSVRGDGSLYVKP